MAVTGITNSTLTQATEPTESRADVTRTQFLQLLVAELTNQDPFEPLDNAAFMSQITQLETLSGNERLVQSIEKMQQQQQLTSAGSMLGAVVRGFTDNNFPIQGTVTGVSIQDGNASIIVDDNVVVAMDKIIEILLPSVANNSAQTDSNQGSTQ